MRIKHKSLFNLLISQTQQTTASLIHLSLKPTQTRLNNISWIDCLLTHSCHSSNVTIRAKLATPIIGKTVQAAIWIHNKNS